MIDPVTAFATAQAAVAGIQKAIKLGKDINGLFGEFSKFFDARDAIHKAANDNAKKGKSDTALAMQIVMQQNALREAEEQLKHQLIYGGYPELWQQMLVERQKIRHQREREEREARKVKARKRQQLIELGAYVFITVGFVAVIMATVYLLMH